MREEISRGIPSHVTADLTAPIAASKDEIRERMSGNICRCGAYSNIDATPSARFGGTGVRPFTYERASTPQAAAAAAAARANAKFIAGGTNLLDLMKHEIEIPRI